MIDVRRAAARYRVATPGITSWHCFAAGPHYDPDNLSFGPVTACDEHLLEPGAGFAAHRHARVELLSWVLDGALRHEDPGGRVAIVRPGQVQYQRAGSGIEHVERNASDAAPLRFVQLWLSDDASEPDYLAATPPRDIGSGSFAVLRGDGLVPAARYVHLHVATGAFEVAGVGLSAGDSLRAAGEDLPVTGSGELLAVSTRA